ncbi:MAG TPA: DUF397 domain-containing protein [Pseudonocardiaceae bacterium]
MSSWSGAGNNCLEVAALPGGRAVRDSKPHRPSAGVHHGRVVRVHQQGCAPATSANSASKRRPPPRATGSGGGCLLFRIAHARDGQLGGCGCGRRDCGRAGPVRPTRATTGCVLRWVLAAKVPVMA